MADSIHQGGHGPPLLIIVFFSNRSCHFRGGFRFNAKDKFQAPSAQIQAIFDEGHEVGNWAKKLFIDGLEVSPGEIDFDKVCSETQRLLSFRQPLFEPEFQAIPFKDCIDLGDYA